MNYEVSLVRLTWKRDGVRYRLIRTRSHETVVEKAVDGQYVLTYVRR